MESQSSQSVIGIDEIDREFRYGHRYDYVDSRLSASLEKKGILWPLLVVSRIGGRNELLSGHRRLFWCRQKGESRVPVSWVQEDFSEQELFLLSLYSNWNQNFTELDRMVALRKAGEDFGLSTEEICGAVAPALGLPSHRKGIENYLEAARLVPEIHRLIHAGKLPFRGASSLTRFTKEEQRLLAGEWFNGMHLTTNQLLLLTEWLADLKKMKAKPLPGVLEETEPGEWRRKEPADLRGRGEKFFREVRSLRYPRLTAAEREFEALKRELREPEEIRLSHPEGFEREGILFQAHLKNREALARILEFLKSRQSTLERFF